MEKLDVAHKLPMSSYKVSAAATRLLLVAYSITKDGFQPGSDIPALWHEVSADVLPAFPYVRGLPGELAAAPLEVVFAALCGMYDGYKTLTK